MKKNIFFSILTPVYNVEKYITQCIESVLKQTYTDYELILVDDGSTDASGEICDAYAEKYSHIRVYHKENEGQLATRCHAIRQAKGEWLICLDSDDTLNCNALSKINSIIIKYACDCVIYGIQRVRDGSPAGKPFAEIERDEVLIEDKRELYRQVLFDDGYNSLCRKAVKADIMGKTNYAAGKRVVFGEDLLQSLDIYQYAEKTLFIKDILYNYTVNPDSITGSVCYENYEVDFFVSDCVLDFLRREDVFYDSDYIEYRTHCIELLCWNIHTIARFCTARSNKTELYEQIRNTGFYQFCVEDRFNSASIGIVNKIIFRSFYNRNYRFIYGFERLIMFLKKLLKKP